MDWGDGTFTFRSDVREREWSIEFHDIGQGTGADLVTRAYSAVTSMSGLSLSIWKTAFSWYYQAARANVTSPTTIAMSFNWIALELLGRNYVYAGGTQGSIKNKSTRVRHMLNAKGFDVSSGSWLDSRPA